MKTTGRIEPARKTAALSAFLRPALVVLCLAIVVTSLPPVFATGDAAWAQTRPDKRGGQVEGRVKRRGIIDLLFAPTRALRRRTSRQPQVEQPVRSAPRRSAPAYTPPPKPEAVEKLDNARKILVVGDFMAQSLSDGLKDAFAKSPGVEIIREAKGSSGLVRKDYYDWSVALPAALDEHDPAIVIIMMGSNDRQEMRLPDGRADIRSPAWTEAYGERVGELALTVRDRNLPLIWVGAPAYSKSRMSADMVAINDLTRNAVVEHKGEFVDIWDGFVSEDGKFVFTGSDIKGQQVRLRTSDGIRMTRAGGRKLAFYVEKPLRRLLGGAADEGVESLSGDNLPELLLSLPDSGDQAIRTRPVALNDPVLDGGATLLGGEAETIPAPERSLRDELVLDGRTSQPPQGRADDFAWPASELRTN